MKVKNGSDDTSNNYLEYIEQSNNLSYLKHNGIEQLKNQTIGQLIDQVTATYGDRDGIRILHGPKLTFKEIHQKVQSFASGLLACGLEKGDHVGLFGPNTLEWYISYLAITKAGLVAVNLSSLYEAPELKLCLINNDIKALVAAEALNGRNYYQIISTMIPSIEKCEPNKPITSEEIPFLRLIIMMSFSHQRGAYRWCDILTLATVVHKKKLQQIQKEIDVHDVCTILMTSGSTGEPKGVLQTHHNLVNNSYFTAKRLLYENKHHVLCLPVPFFHSFGTSIGILTAMHFGTTIVLPSMKFSPTKTIEAVIAEKCTVIYGTPTMYLDILSVANKMSENDPQIFLKMSSLEIGFVAGSICPAELFKKLINIFNFRQIHSGYGMTECSPIMFISKPDDTAELITSTIGCIADHAEVKVIDEYGNLVPFGTVGEVCFKGYMVTQGYYNMPDQTERAFLKERWLRSGDKMKLYENGYGQIVGRIKDTIIRGGENIEPSEIEHVLSLHPEIQQIQVYAVSDERLGEVVAASIIRIPNSSLNEQGIRKFCDGKFAPHKIPKYIKFVDSFKIVGAGKIRKSELRESLERELNLKQQC